MFQPVVCVGFVSWRGHTGVITKRGVENIKSLDCGIQVYWLQKMVTNETANIVTELIRGKEIANPQQ